MTFKLCLNCLQETPLNLLYTTRGRPLCIECANLQEKKLCIDCSQKRPLSEYRKLLDSNQQFQGDYSRKCKWCEFRKKQRRRHTPKPPPQKEQINQTTTEPQKLK